MRSVAFVSLALLALAGPAAVPARAQTGPGTEAQNTAPAQAGQPQPAVSAAQPAQAAQAATSPTTRIPSERRRGRTYARCNRAAYNRNLRGGARRRFLIRCSLGYERGIGQPPAPVRKP